MIVKALKGFFPKNARFFSTKIKHDYARPQYVDDTKRVELRGTFIKGNYDDLPTLIFFPEACDSVGNWSSFFTNPVHQILEHRNVYLLYPRNFGNSDRHPCFDLEDMTNDIARFMYEKKISTATFGGHGFGGKLAVAMGCYHGDRVTGVFAIDSAPMDQRFHEPFHEFKRYIEILNGLDLRSDKGTLEKHIVKSVDCPKWRKLFVDNLTRVSDTRLDWNFAMEYLHHNITFNKAESIGYWATKHGLYTGRGLFIFPEYSRWVLMATNTLPMMKICPQVQGYGRDIIAVQGDENPLNHWVYDFPTQEFVFAKKVSQFLRHKDGVHVLLNDRSEIGTYMIPDRINSRKDADHLYSDYSPPHLHHNWRFSNIYDVSKQFAAKRNADLTKKAE